MTQPLLVILGPTASGKTKLAVAVAERLNGEIISADSRQIFKGMDVGTGKDLDEYEVGEQQIPHHLIDIRQAGETYHVNAFKEDFYTAFDQINHRGHLPILCGGTGMYIHSLLQNHEFTAIPVNEPLRAQLLVLTKTQLQHKLNAYPESLRLHVDYSSIKRLMRAIEIAEYLTYHQLVKIERTPIQSLVIGLQGTIETRRKKIIDRLNLRLESGLIQEVAGLLAKGISKEMLIFYGLEYKFVASYLANEMSFDTLKERLGIAICQFAKRQMTFFRKMEKDGVAIHWLNADQDFIQLKEEAIELITHRFDLK